MFFNYVRILNLNDQQSQMKIIRNSIEVIMYLTKTKGKVESYIPFIM